MTAAPMLPFYGHREKAIDSLGESKSMFEIATGLAAKLGISDFSDKTEEEWLREASSPKSTKGVAAGPLRFTNHSPHSNSLRCGRRGVAGGAVIERE